MPIASPETPANARKNSRPGCPLPRPLAQGRRSPRDPYEPRAPFAAYADEHILASDRYGKILYSIDRGSTVHSGRSRLHYQLAASEPFAQATLDALSAHIAVLDASGDIIAVNKSWENFPGGNPPVPVTYGLGANYLALCDQASLPTHEYAHRTAEGIREVMSGVRAGFELEYTCPANGEERWFVVRVTSFGDSGHLVVSHENISARKQAEAALRRTQEQLVQQERLAAVGQLAAGIAHDFNNILTIIGLQVQIAQRTPDLAPDLQKRLETIARQSGRAATLIQQILDFGGRAVLRPRPLDLALLLREQAELYRRALPEHIQVILEEKAEECIVQADPGRIQQMLSNLVFNARDAMSTGGMLRIGLDKRQLAGDESALPPDLEAGLWVVVTVSDTGVGIAPETLPHIYEPFFTTKEHGKGAGLGLSQVYGIVKQHNGHIAVQTQAGAGATFTVYLPALPSAPEVLHPPAHLEALPHGQGETILVVEDNPSLREAMVEMLALLHYKTLAASDGRQALAMLEAQPGQIDLVLSDLLMPEMGGEALYHALRQRGLTLPVVLLSGHPMEVELQALQDQGAAGWLLKPLETSQLATLLAQALGNA